MNRAGAMAKALIVAAGLALAGLHAAPARADQPVALRAAPADENGQVTLGDLFDGAGDQADVVVASGRAGLGMVLDAGRVQMFARAHGLDWNNPGGIRRLIVQPGAPRAQHASSSSSVGGSGGDLVITGPSTHEIPVLAYTRDIAPGDVIQAGDVEPSRTAIPIPDAPRSADSVVGMAARRYLRQGQSVAQHDVTQPQVIKKDDVIALIYSQDGITLTLQAKAMDNAVVGQTFNAVNTESKKIIQAVAAGPGQALVGPQADEARAEARLNPSLLALLH
ncbi:MAG TPA: flagellar basal body P-ring formation chaperone FlgA [Caulobacteraceae bacterium]|nr:flagellar basal body P-ring formation chaperone FlgA [Caulobacteraceae bacterium]